MREMILNKSHDIEVVGDHFARFMPDSAGKNISLAQQVTQAALCMLKTEQGEAFTNGDHGCPWFNQILGLAPVHLDVAKRIIKTKLSAVPGVAEVGAVSIDSDGRNLTGSFKLICTDGTTAEGNF